MYSRQKEDAAEKAFTDIGFVLIEDTGRRKKHVADRLMRHPNCNISIAIDHKSTTNKGNITITKEMLDKIREEAGDDMIPVITFSLYGMGRKFLVMEISDLGLFCN